MTPDRSAPRAARPAPSTDGQPAHDPATLRARLDAHQRANPPRPQRPPPDPGRILCRVARSDGTELRVSLHHYEGKPYVRVGPWQSSAPDAWPEKGKGATVKVRELGAVAAALLDALDAIADARANNDGAQHGDDGRRQP